MGSFWSLFKQTDTLDNIPNYKGTWQSNSYPSVKGTMTAYLKVNADAKPTQAVSFDAQSLVHYDPNSVYKADWKVKMDVNGYWDPAAINRSEGHNTVSQSYQFPSLNVKPGMTLETVDQSLRYIVNYAGENGDLTVIQGNYISHSPADKGTFQLKYCL